MSKRQFMIETGVTSSRKAALVLALWAAAPILGGGIVSEAHAGPFKQNMQRMNQTTKAAKAELGAFNPGNAAALLQQYVEEAREGEQLSGGDASAKSKDLHARFARLASTAESGAADATNQAQFRKVFVDIATQCKSCHSVYK